MAVPTVAVTVWTVIGGGRNGFGNSHRSCSACSCCAATVRVHVVVVAVVVLVLVVVVEVVVVVDDSFRVDDVKFLRPGSNHDNLLLWFFSWKLCKRAVSKRSRQKCKQKTRLWERSLHCPFTSTG